MKKVVGLLFVGILMFLAACGQKAAEETYFTAYNGEKLQIIEGEAKENYSPASFDGIVFYRAEESETVEQVVAAMKMAILEPLTKPSDNRAFTVTDYDISMQSVQKLGDNEWLLPYLEGTYAYEGTDLVMMETRLSEENPDTEGRVPFVRQGSDASFRFVLVKEGDVYRLQKLSLMAEQWKLSEQLLAYAQNGFLTPTTTAASTQAPEPVRPAGPLTEEEIKFFNEKFFTTETEYPGRWVRNNILYTEFANPAQVDIEAMFYDEESVEKISKEERAYLREQLDEQLDTSKFTEAYINEVMQTYLGISLEESEKNGLDKIFYNAEYDAYYLMHSDALCVCVQVESGERKEDGTVTLVYRKAHQLFTHMTEQEINALPQYQVVLKETENGYQFLSNQIVTQQ